MSRRLSTTLGAGELYRAIHDETAEAVGAAGFYLALHDQSRDLARIVYYADRGSAQRVDLSYRGSDSEVFRTQCASRVDDDLEDGSLLVLGDDKNDIARSAITAPITFNGRLIGALSAQSYEPAAYTDEDLDLLEGIADVAAVALQNSIHFEELERRRVEAERLEEIARVLTSELNPDYVMDQVVSAIQELLPVDGSAVWQCDLDADSVCRVAQSGGDIALPVGLEWDIEGDLLSTLDGERAAVMIDRIRTSDLPAQVAEHMTGGSAVGVPVVVDGRLAGVLTAGSKQPRRFSHDDTRVLQRLADQFAIALGNARLHEDLHALSLTDPLTGLANRRLMQIHLEPEVAAARRGRPLSIALIDIDRFKHYNDTFGHVAGDQILKVVGGILSEENRAMNVVARYGGDEFVSVLSDTVMDGARHYAERVTQRVGADDALKEYGITVSVGVAEFDPESMATVNDMLRAADADMYEAKSAGAASRKAVS